MYTHTHIHTYERYGAFIKNLFFCGIQNAFRTSWNTNWFTLKMKNDTWHDTALRRRTNYAIQFIFQRLSGAKRLASTHKRTHNAHSHKDRWYIYVCVCTASESTLSLGDSQLIQVTLKKCDNFNYCCEYRHVNILSTFRLFVISRVVTGTRPPHCCQS